MPKRKNRKSVSKLTLALTFCLLLFLEGFYLLGVKNDFYHPMAVEASSFQNTTPSELDKQLSLLTSSSKETAYSSTFGKVWDFSKVSEWGELAKIDDDSAEVVIGINYPYADNYNRIANIVKIYKGKIVNIISMGGKIEAIVADVPMLSVSSFVKETKATGGSAYVEPNLKFKADFIPNDPYWSKQWGPTKMGADIAWNTQLGNKSVLVAVIDTGIDWNHPDLAANYVPLGYDWVNNDTDPMDDHGHGTHCAGIIAAALNNSIGIAGLAQVRIMAEKGLDSSGYGSEDNLAKAIIHAVDQGAKILSNSWGDYEESALLYDAIKYAYDRGVLIIAAAGNDAISSKSYPAGYDEVVAVTATNASDAPASFTNFGNWVELAAPGVGIYSTVYDNSYAYMSGTSMACPHVAGVAALVWSQFPKATQEWVRYWLRYTADDLGDSGFDVYYGYGRVNASRAVGEPPNHEVLISDLEAPRYIEPGDVGKINSTIFNLGRSNETDLTVQLLANGTVVDSVHVNFLASGVSRAINFSWSPMINGKYNITSYIVPISGEENLANNARSTIVRVYHPEVVLFQNVAPWGLSSNEEVFDLYDVPYVTLSSEYFEAVNLSQYKKVVIASDQDQTFYDAMNSSRLWLENYVRNGGVLEIHAADQGWHSGVWLGVLPGGLQWQSQESNYATIVDPTHPVLNTPNRISDSELDSWSLSVHGYFSDYPENSSIILVESSGEPVYLEFKYGSGLIVASGQTLEWAYNEYSLMLENSLLYSIYKCTHELAAFLGAPIFLAPNDSSLLNATVINYGSSNEANVDLRLLIDGDIIDSLLIPELATDAQYTMSYLWTPISEEIYNVTAYVQPLLEEKVKANNVASEIVPVRYVKNVLFDQTHGTDNINCYNVWTASLTGRGFVIDLHTTGVIADEMLNNYDVFVIPQADIPYQPSELAAIRNFVQAGGGLLVIGDNEPSIYTNLTSFVGITWSDYMAGGVARDITPDIITVGVASVDLLSPFAKMDVNGSAQGIVKLEEDIMLSVSLRSVGKVIGFADENALWDIGIGGGDNLRLANNMMEWLSLPAQYQHETSVDLEAPAHIASHGSALLNATVYNNGLNNETNIQLSILINGSVTDSTMIPELLVDSAYTLSYLWTSTIDGVYNVTAYAIPVVGESFTSNNLMSKIVRVGYADVAVISVSQNVSIAYIGSIVNIAAVAKNLGIFTETFIATLHANSTIADVKTVTGLAPNSQIQVLFHWNTNGMAKGNYTISVVAEPVIGETELTNNNCVGGRLFVTIVGDLGGGNKPTFFHCDGIVNGKDLALFLYCYKGLAPPEAMYLADLGGGMPPQFFMFDGKVDGKDLELFLLCFKKLGP
jgi:hypothetical protein